MDQRDNQYDDDDDQGINYERYLKQSGTQHINIEPPGKQSPSASSGPSHPPTPLRTPTPQPAPLIAKPDDRVIMDDIYLDWLKEDDKLRKTSPRVESGPFQDDLYPPEPQESKAQRLRRNISKLFGSKRGQSVKLKHDIPRTKPSNPVRLPVDNEGYPAVYGVYLPTTPGERGGAIHGPADWEQFYNDWDRIGKEYKKVPKSPTERFGQLFGSFIEDILPERSPLNRKQMKFLKKKGYTFIKKLGRGGYGDVYLAREYRVNWVEGRKNVVDRQLACKVLLLKKMKERQHNVASGIDSLTREEEIYQDLKHNYIVERVTVININDPATMFHGPIFVLFFMELMEGELTDLFYVDTRRMTSWQSDEAIKKLLWGKLGPEKFTHYWAKQITSGLRYLHENRIAHFDIKPANILYSTHTEAGTLHYTFKLTDFGVAEKFESWKTAEGEGERGSPGFMAPEVANWQSGHPPYNAFKPDIYSFGMTLADSVGNSKWGKREIVRELVALSFQDIYKKLEIGPELTNLILSCIIPDPNRRFDIIAVCQYNWITDFYADGHYL